MKNRQKYTKWIWLLVVTVLLSVSCNDEDPYKNPKKPQQETPSSPTQPKKPRRGVQLPEMPGCSRPVHSPAGGGGGGGGSGCQRRIEKVRERRPQRPPRQHPQRAQRRKKVKDPNAPVYPCPDHIFPFCTDENPYGVTYKSGTQGMAAFPRSMCLGCLKIAPGPIWYYMQIDQPGDLLIYIEQKRLRGRRGLDVDFACWGPFEAESKRDFLNKLCSSYYALNVDPHENHRPENGDHTHDMGGYPFDNLVDCSFDPAATEWCYIPNAKTGEWYLLLLTNYSRKRGEIHFERVDERSTATTNCNVVVPIVLNPIPKDLKQIDEKTWAICIDEEKALIPVELETYEDYTLPKESLQRTKVVVYANGRTYEAKLKNGVFECEIDIFHDTTEYSAICTCADPAFELQTEKCRIVRTEDCEPTHRQFSKGNPQYAGDLTTLEMVKGDKSVEVDFSDPNRRNAGGTGSEGINLDDYDVAVDYDGLLIERVDINKEDNTLELTPHLRGDWCDCFLLDTITVTAIMTPKQGKSHVEPYVIPIKIGVLHRSVWVGRCFWALMSIIGLFLFVLYLRALLRKNRFKKYAMIKPSYYRNVHGRNVEETQSGTFLRKPGFVAWLNRWFNPFVDEQATYSWTAPKTVPITFVASSSKEEVLITKTSFKPDTMSMPGYHPQIVDDKARCIPMSGKVSIYADRSKKKMLGNLSFDSGSGNDEGGFRLFVGILLIVSLVAIGILTFLMLKILV